VDGTLLKAWASLKSFRRKDGGDNPPSPGRNGERDFKGELRKRFKKHTAAVTYIRIEDRRIG
jgi:hypothetical protein